ncbi:HAD family hydrolase [Sporosarcina sp. Te-1]|uniref:HAD family hydrolase n=1 Tax=Sporosarcina sp. Te-1 TaxID=2818390 RepID=UPI001A9DC93E|nr:HAD family hydrolase [Sporosarcina sp. Te-1]QTD42892.1 HAD family hydrolase [Sporosarcina sp. Te-1]
MIKAVLFDLDGTLLNRDASVVTFIEDQYERLQQIIGHIPKRLYIDRFLQLDNGGYTWKDQVYAQLVKEFDITAVTSEQLLEDYLIRFNRHCIPFPAVKETLQQLRKLHLKIGMITNGKEIFQMENIRALGITQLLDVILISESEGVKKPDAAIFHRALKQLQVIPSESIFIGDHPVNDVEAARNVGMRAIWKRDNRWDAVKADFTIDGLQEILDIVRQLRASD